MRERVTGSSGEASCPNGSSSREAQMLLVEQGVDEGVRIEGKDVFHFFADAGEDDRQAELGGDGEHDAALGGAVELSENDAGDASGFGEEAGLLQAVLAGGGIHDEQRLMRCAGDQFFGGATHLVELLHQVGLGVEAAGGIDDEDVGSARLSGGAGVVERGGGIATLFGLDDGDA